MKTPLNSSSSCGLRAGLWTAFTFSLDLMPQSSGRFFKDAWNEWRDEHSNITVTFEGVNFERPTTGA
jgi:hypothetical protein